ncbi:hypothetical protein OEZ85_014188 [Tetradesmus obliquus]|uniref:Uncharacterized protein n=1 Tax=Tetradesmus obliquus TaxID=3088 RepID=A0ABY8U772_TETOB|nr:hypothetical protein OEZ85_014188 [Tetradesmus obliquus]
MEFDSWTGDTIACCEDCNTLVKAAKYFREQGFHPTAEAIDSRLNELGVVKATSPPAVELDTAEAKRSILSFQEESKKLLQQQRNRLAEARQQGMQAELHPPVRGAINGKKANLGSAKDINSQAAAAIPRQSLDLSDQKDQQMLGPGGLKEQEEEQQAKPLIQEVLLTGAKRTQQLVQQNMQLPAADRRAMAASKRASGNDNFRAGAYADAVEEYTLSVSLDPAAVPVYTNRAAAYLKLKEWQAAAADCDMALTLLEGETGDKDKLDDLRSKACLRRAEALAAMGNNQAALADWKAVLQLYPDEPKAKQGVEVAEKALGISSSSSTATQPGMRRIAVQEADSSDEDDDADMAARIKAAAEAHAAAEADDNSSSRDSDFDSATEEDADDDDLAAAAGGFSMDADVADPLVESAVELPPSYEQQLDQLREAGNAKFRTGAYAEAINLYEQALSHAPGDVRLYNNCAIAKLYLEKFDAAHKDATLAIVLDPTNSKAYHRRHKAKIGLKDYMGAMLDLQQCMQHAAAKERKALQEELEALQEQMDAEIAEAETAAEAARAASAATYNSCTIEEVAEEPMEAFQRKHDELQDKERWIARVAKGMQDTAAQLREEWEQGRQQQQERTPAGSYKATSTLLQQQQRRQQQQQHSRAPPTAAEVQQSLEQRVETLKQQGNAALKAGQLAAAEAAYMEALQLDGDNVKVLLNLAQLRLAQKDGAGAVRAAEEVLALPGVEEDSRRKATLRLGLGLELRGSSSGSSGVENKFAEVIYKRDDKAAAAREAGERALKQGNAQSALKQYNTAVAKQPTDSRAYAGRAQVWLRLKRPQHAEQDCGLALLLATCPKAVAPGLVLGQKAGQESAAVDVALLGRVRRVRAMAWREMGKLKEAVADLKQLLADSPGDASLQRLVADLTQAYAKQDMAPLRAVYKLR